MGREDSSQLEASKTRTIRPRKTLCSAVVRPTHQKRTDKMSKIIAIGYKNAAAVYAHLLNWNKTTQPMTIAMREAIHCPVWGKDRRGGGEVSIHQIMRGKIAPLLRTIHCRDANEC